MSERRELRLVRERLESVLSPNVAGAALFEALEAAGSSPGSATAAVALVTGPLTDALIPRIGANDTHAIVDEILLALGPAVQEEQASGRQGVRADTTLEIPLSKAGLPVLVLSAGDEMANQLEGALGADRISAAGVKTAMGLRRALDAIAPGVVIVDAARFPTIEPADVATALAALPRSVLRVIWGSDLPYGSVTSTECARLGVSTTSLDRREGIAPLVDLVRARTESG